MLLNEINSPSLSEQGTGHTQLAPHGIFDWYSITGLNFIELPEQKHCSTIVCLAEMSRIPVIICTYDMVVRVVTLLWFTNVFGCAVLPFVLKQNWIPVSKIFCAHQTW